MEKYRHYFSLGLSVGIHVGVILLFIFIIQQTHSQSSGALINAPVFSIALTPNVIATPKMEKQQPKANTAVAQPDLTSPDIIEKAEIIVAKKQEEIEKKEPKPEPKIDPKPITKTLTIKKTTRIEKETENTKETAEANSSSKPLLAGNDQAFSQQAAPTQNATAKLTEQADNGQFDEYRAKIRQEVERNKEYPRRARKMKISGNVLIRFQITANGKLTSPAIITSSGNELLDNAAIAAVNRSQPVGNPPLGFTSSLTLTIEFIAQ